VWPLPRNIEDDAGRLIDSQWSYAVEVVMVFFAVFGSWSPIELGSRLLARRASATH
jgi:hypothetical protein